MRNSLINLRVIEEMKQLFIIAALIVITTMSGVAQNIDDALRYSQTYQMGTARFNSMGGAFTALGGDASSLSQNPAGIGVYRSSEFTLTPMLLNGQTTSYFKNNNTEDNMFDFNVSQLGVILSFNQAEKTKGLLSFNFGYAMNQKNNFGNSSIIKGIGNNSSMTDYWADMASNGYPEGGGFYSDELVNDTYLAWKSFLIDTLSNQFTSYGSAFSNYGENSPVYGQTIKRLVASEGTSSEHALSFGGNISDKFFFGATIGINSFDYRSTYTHSETVPTALNHPSLLSSFSYDLTYSNSGTGANFKFGAIYRPIEPLRLAFAFHTPTVYKIDEYVSDNISAYYSGTTARRANTSYSASNKLTTYEYRLKTPAKALFGAAYQLGKLGIVSVDYELVNYSNAKFSQTGDGYDYSAKNAEIDNLLKMSNNLRLGAEFRISKLYLRGGYAYYGAPWSVGDINSGKDINIVSGGLGFRSNHFFADFSYSGMFNNQTYILYTAPTETAIADIDGIRNHFALTFGFRF